MTSPDEPFSGKNPGDGAAGPTSGGDLVPAADRARFEKDEKTVREGFWPKLKRVVGRLSFAEDLLAAYYCALDPKTPLRVRATLLAALAYFIAPVDLVPDVFIGFGFTDDAAVLLAAIRTVAASITPGHRDRARETLETLKEA